MTQDDSTEDGGITVIEVTKANTAQKGTITIYKTGEVFASAVVAEGVYQPVYAEQGLPGAVYEITAAEDIYTLDGTLRYAAGEVVDTITTDDTGYATSKVLYWWFRRRQNPILCSSQHTQWQLQLYHPGPQG